MAIYRTLSTSEIEAAVDLWVEVFGVEAPYFQTLLDGDDSDAVSLGAFEEGRLVSSVHVFIRWFRGREGRPQRVGAIGSVSTAPNARSRGHSSHLLQMAIQEMEARDCVWSYLGTGVNNHYAKQGWRTVSTPYFKGVPKEGMIEPLEVVMVTDELLEAMALIHDEYSQIRPMANARSRQMWHTAVRYRITGHLDEVYTWNESGVISAYLVARRAESHVELIEAACREGTEDDLRDLVRKRLLRARKDQFHQVVCHLPEESEGFSAFAAACTEVSPAEDRSWMARPIANRITCPDLAALLADPRGRRSDLDNF